MMLNPFVGVSVLLLYFSILVLMGWITSKNVSAHSFFNADRNAKWYLVAYGMIGASLSGVTFISIPGEVGKIHFNYFQVVMGYMIGYLIIGTILLPLYYKQSGITIYSYLANRLGKISYKTGAWLFLISRLIGSSFRLYLVALVLQLAIFDPLQLPFWLCVIITIVLIWIYTFKGGIKTIVWTDTIQTTFMLAAVGITIYQIQQSIGMSWIEVFQVSEHIQIFNWDWRSSQFFGKQFISGIFIAIVMTGLDQDMMQKNLSCRTLEESQKNMFWFSILLLIVNFFFLALGMMLYAYADFNQILIPSKTDQFYPLLAFQYFGFAGAFIFLIGVVAAAYSSADSAMTAMTTSFYIDILQKDIEKDIHLRKWIHLIIASCITIAILLFHRLNNQSVISAVLTIAGYTYGPLLGMFSFGIFTKKQVNDRLVPVICVLSPIITYWISLNSIHWFWGYQMGFELLVINGLLSFLALLFTSKSANIKQI